MPIEVLMPALSPTMKEGNLAKWLKKEGDNVAAGDVIAEIETDKATMEVEAVDEGILGKIIIKDGTQNVAVNSLIALILEDGEKKSSLDSYKIAQNDNTKQAPKEEVVKEAAKTQAPKVEIPKVVKQAPIAPPISVNKNNKKVTASPVAKKIAAQQNIDISNISGTGPNGRIIKEDLINLGQGNKSGVIQRNPQEFELQQNGNVRKIIAQRLLESKLTVPHFYLNLDIQIDKLLELRKDLNDNALVIDGKPSYKVSVNDLVIKAVALALKKVPAANSSWYEDAIALYNNIDISVAVAAPDGLITPIVKNADQKSIIEISNEMKTLIKKARDGKLQPEEFQGGGFSISNLGMYGIDSFNAIVNPPQSCILAVGAGVKKPIIKDDKIEIGHIMYASLSCDHRSVDGAVGAEFLSALKTIIQNPITMLI